MDKITIYTKKFTVRLSMHNIKLYEGMEAELITDELGNPKFIETPYSLWTEKKVQVLLNEVFYLENANYFNIESNGNI